MSAVPVVLETEMTSEHPMASPSARDTHTLSLVYDHHPTTVTPHADLSLLPLKPHEISEGEKAGGSRSSERTQHRLSLSPHLFHLSLSLLSPSPLPEREKSSDSWWFLALPVLDLGAPCFPASPPPQMAASRFL